MISAKRTKNGCYTRHIFASKYTKMLLQPGPHGAAYSAPNFVTGLGGYILAEREGDKKEGGEKEKGGQGTIREKLVPKRMYDLGSLP